MMLQTIHKGLGPGLDPQHQHS